MMWSRFARMIGLVSVFLVAACGEGDEAAQAEKADQAAPPAIKLALVMKTLTNPFFVTMEKGARRAEAEFGIELQVKTAAEETSIHQQIDIVNQLVRDGEVKAIIIAPGDSVQLIPALKAAQDAGIKVVNIDNQLDQNVSKNYGLTDVPFISVDNAAAAYLSAKYIADRMTGPTKAAILEGIPTAANAKARKAGAERAFEESPNISIVASTPANWKIDEAYAVTSQIFEENPDIGAIFSSNDMMAMGVLKYLEENRLDTVLVAGFDAIEEAKSAIQQGKLAVTIDQLPAEQGYAGVKMALDLINGKPAPSEIMIDVQVVDQAALQ
ncbi:MAG: substrate-binding domain-containing protein [Magnetovibrionaceae bacterium]